jgi:hypothetical protein
MLNRFNKVSLARRFYLIGFIAPEGELLSFARPKESNQRKGRPVAACFLRSSLLCPLWVFAEGCQKGLLSLWQRASSMKRPFGLFSAKAAVLGAANGMKPLTYVISVNKKHYRN